MNKIKQYLPKSEQITNILFIAMFITCMLLAFSSNVMAVPEEDLAKMEDRTFRLINEARASKGLKPLIKEKAAWSAARDHSADMADRDFFSHTSPEGKGVLDRIKVYGFNLVGKSLGENIAMNYNTTDPVETAVSGWLKSPGHYKNIMDSRFIYSGIGIVKTPDGKYYFTQVFWGKY